MGTPQPFQILKMDRRRGNIVVSRRAVLEDSRAEARTELVANLQEGQVLQGVIKNITDYCNNLLSEHSKTYDCKKYVFDFISKSNIYSNDVLI